MLIYLKFSLNGAWRHLTPTKAPTPEVIHQKEPPCTGSKCCTVELVNEYINYIFYGSYVKLTEIKAVNISL